jgi:oligopeptide transport system substrate-binding protein
MARFDYLGFGPELTADPAAREALTLALDYAELKKLLASRGELGCPSLPESYLASRPCYRMDLSRARALWEKVDPTLRARRLTLGFSSQGGEDIRTQAQWFQNQWKKHLHLNVELTSLDDAMHVARLRQAPPAFFRRGVSLDRPTCLAALETFRADSPENFLRINDTAFENLLGSLVSAVDGSAKKTACSKAIEHLMNRHLFIPLGEMHFSMMMKPQWEGFEVNELNQLDLSRLRRKTDASGKNKDTL